MTSDFTSEENKSLECLLKRIDVHEQKNEAENDDLAAIAIRDHHDALIINIEYLDTIFLTSSLNRCERLLSVAKPALSYLRKSMDMESFE